MKYTGIILGAIATICMLFTTTMAVLTCQFGLAVVLAFMTLLGGAIIICEYNEIKEGGDQWQH